jgi:hypothetical protein
MKIRIDFYSLAQDEDTHGSVCKKNDFFHLFANSSYVCFANSSYVCFYTTFGKTYPHVYISNSEIKAELEENVGTVIKKE